MNIAIIGSGNIGSTLARGLSKSGHQIYLGTRHPEDEKIKNLIRENNNIEALSVSEAAQRAEVIIIAAPPDATKDIVHHMGDVKGKILIDTMNSVRTKAGDFVSSAEALRVWTGNNDVVKCFNTTGFNIMANPDFSGIKADMFMAGSSKKGKEIARQLALDMGFDECYDFGGDDKIPLLEQFAFIWINLAINQNLGRDIAFKLLKK
ncbi:MAG: NAD(P)-binding domain-containing protein [Cytophagaceae bacterium]|nr:NAD(P)-binding domain-containing protein [Cytophagaceae bacterium]MDW8456516.1 NAD(P)-binding domain-containing protein [Cytophagaceae bacterium]